jgi:antitoxin PrlF
MKYEFIFSFSYFPEEPMAKHNRLKAVVAERGQVTIPKRIRDTLGLMPGAILTFELSGNKITISKEVPTDPIAGLFGCLKGTTPYTSTDAYIKEIRGAADTAKK